MIDPFPFINTLLLAAIFYYQHSKNKILNDRISSQTQLIEETNSIVTQQATALDSQSKVVETAVLYSQAFDPAKLENTLRTHLEFETATKISKIRKEFEDELHQKDSEQEQQVASMVEELTKGMQEITAGYIMPLSELVRELMIIVPNTAREDIIAELPESEMKQWLLSLSESIDAEYRASLPSALSQLLSSVKKKNGEEATHFAHFDSDELGQNNI